MTLQFEHSQLVSDDPLLYIVFVYLVAKNIKNIANNFKNLILIK
jgi:hypothetical protein